MKNNQKPNGKKERNLFVAFVLLCVTTLCCTACANPAQNFSATQNVASADDDISTDKADGFGVFYSLEYAYQTGLIDEDDVRSIGYYHHGGKEYQAQSKDFVSTDYLPIAKEPKDLDESKAMKIKADYVQWLNDSIDDYFGSMDMSGAEKMRKEEKDIADIRYYGTYNGYYAVNIVLSGLQLQIINTTTIAGTTFFFGNPAETIFIYDEN